MSTQSRIPPAPGDDEILLHNRSYDVQAFRIDAQTMRLRGRVTDTKPAGLYVQDDTEPLAVHDMVVDMEIGFPLLEILAIDVVLDTHPNLSCPSIEPAFHQLVGTSIARGFSRQLTELFGGPKGCTHVVALLRAMAPVAVQSIYSMAAADPNDPSAPWDREKRTEDERRQALEFTRDSCHVWETGGEKMLAAQAGEVLEAPIWIRDRLNKLDRSDEIKGWQ